MLSGHTCCAGAQCRLMHGVKDATNLNFKTCQPIEIPRWNSLQARNKII